MFRLFYNWKDFSLAPKLMENCKPRHYISNLTRNNFFLGFWHHCQHQNQFFFLNLHEISAFGWIERKPNFRLFLFLFFELRSFQCHFCDVITPIFDDNSKNKNRRIFFIIFPFYSACSAPFVTTFWGHHFWGGFACP